MSEQNGQEQADRPPEQAAMKLVPSPLTGFVPPVEHRFKKGQSGNPQGRRITKELDEQLAPHVVEVLVRNWIAKAIEGDMRALEMLLDRHEGKLLQKSEVDATQRTIIIEAGMDETPDPLPEQPA